MFTLPGIATEPANTEVTVVGAAPATVTDSKSVRAGKDVRDIIPCSTNEVPPEAASDDTVLVIRIVSEDGTSETIVSTPWSETHVTDPEKETGTFSTPTY